MNHALGGGSARRVFSKRRSGPSLGRVGGSCSVRLRYVTPIMPGAPPLNTPRPFRLSVFAVANTRPGRRSDEREKIPVPPAPSLIASPSMPRSGSCPPLADMNHALGPESARRVHEIPSTPGFMDMNHTFKAESARHVHERLSIVGAHKAFEQQYYQPVGYQKNRAPIQIMNKCSALGFFNVCEARSHVLSCESMILRRNWQ